ncbi:sensor histidine kinase [Sphingomonas phyllosphaerae]|uniref:sensor histidine kinase n=1 Tax=Sphingomonas phyllosphaerae TaxID=257003 RepID=UPI00048F4DFE|nr:cache domain-containing protein [Sphingomonas phyllosphaerae]
MRLPLRLLVPLAVIAAATLFYLAVAPWTAGRARDEARATALGTARQQARLLDSELNKYRLLPIVLSEYSDLRDALSGGTSADAARRLDRKLAPLAERTGAAVIYAIDARGMTVAASNAARADSFVGHDYRFRPYYRLAMRDGSAEYFALGNVSGRPGLFLSRRIDGPRGPTGVVVVKVEFDAVTRAWSNDPGTTLLVDGRGIVLATTDPREALRTLRPLSPAVRAAVRASGQFGSAPLPLTHLRPGTDPTQLTIATPLDVRGWQLVRVVPIARALREAAGLARLATATFALVLLLLAALLAWRTTRLARAATVRAQLQAAVSERTAELSAEMERRADADQRFRAAREELAQANRLASLGSITAGLAHEINQPVATIRTLAENAQHHLAAGRNDRVAATLDSAVALTARIGSITQEMRRFARRGSGRIEPVALDEVFDGTLLLVGDRLRGANVAVDWPRRGQPAVVAGRVRLEQVLVNLLNNAVDAVAARDDPRIAVLVEERETCVDLIVADNGSGIDPALGEEVFSPFVTGKPDGLGLGLGIARDIMAQFDGALRIVPSPLGGAAFMASVKRA